MWESVGVWESVCGIESGCESVRERVWGKCVCDVFSVSIFLFPALWLAGVCGLAVKEFRCLVGYVHCALLRTVA